MPQLTVGASAVKLISNKSGRRFCEIKNRHATTTLYIGDNKDVTKTNGHAIEALSAFDFGDQYTGDIWVVAESGSIPVTWIEW